MATAVLRPMLTGTHAKRYTGCTSTQSALPATYSTARRPSASPTASTDKNRCSLTIPSSSAYSSACQTCSSANLRPRIFDQACRHIAQRHAHVSVRLHCPWLSMCGCILVHHKQPENAVSKSKTIAVRLQPVVAEDPAPTGHSQDSTIKIRRRDAGSFRPARVSIEGLQDAHA